MRVPREDLKVDPSLYIMIIHPKLPTDLEILNKIYELYYDDFLVFDENNPTREAKYIVPIDCEEVAKRLNANPDLVFSRLYYHLNEKHGYSKIMPDGKELLVKVFIREPGRRKHYVHFPFMTSVLADLRDKEDKFWTTILATILIAGVSLISIATSGLC